MAIRTRQRNKNARRRRTRRNMWGGQENNAPKPSNSCQLVTSETLMWPGGPPATDRVQGKYALMVDNTPSTLFDTEARCDVQLKRGDVQKTKAAYAKVGEEMQAITSQIEDDNVKKVIQAGFVTGMSKQWETAAETGAMSAEVLEGIAIDVLQGQLSGAIIAAKGKLNVAAQKAIRSRLQARQDATRAAVAEATAGVSVKMKANLIEDSIRLLNELGPLANLDGLARNKVVQAMAAKARKVAVDQVLAKYRDIGGLEGCSSGDAGEDAAISKTKCSQAPKYADLMGQHFSAGLKTDVKSDAVGWTVDSCDTDVTCKKLVPAEVDANKEFAYTLAQLTNGERMSNIFTNRLAAELARRQESKRNHRTSGRRNTSQI